jgi:hypothetical protein
LSHHTTTTTAAAAAKTATTTTTATTTHKEQLQGQQFPRVSHACERALHGRRQLADAVNAGIHRSAPNAVTCVVCAMLVVTRTDQDAEGRMRLL